MRGTTALSMALPSYVVISPVRDEEEHVVRTATRSSHRCIVRSSGSSSMTVRQTAHRPLPRPTLRSTTGSRSWTPAGRTGGRAALRSCVPSTSDVHRYAPTRLRSQDGRGDLPSRSLLRVDRRVFARDERAAIAGGAVLTHDGRRWVPDVAWRPPTGSPRPTAANSWTPSVDFRRRWGGTGSASTRRGRLDRPDAARVDDPAPRIAGPSSRPIGHAVKRPGHAPPGGVAGRRRRRIRSPATGRRLVDELGPSP